MAIIWGIIGIFLCASIIGLPFGMQCFKLAKFSFLPIGKRVELKFSSHPAANIVWVLLIGWIMALLYLLFGIANCATVFGIPTGIRCFRIMKLAICPFGANIKKSVK